MLRRKAWDYPGPRGDAGKAALAAEIEVWKAQQPVTPQETAAQALLDLILDISEYCWYAGWYADIEYMLWDARENGPQYSGHGLITAEHCSELRFLSEVAGGWWWWPDDADEETFITLGEWRQRHSKAGHGNETSTPDVAGLDISPVPGTIRA